MKVEYKAVYPLEEFFLDLTDHEQYLLRTSSYTFSHQRLNEIFFKVGWFGRPYAITYIFSPRQQIMIEKQLKRPRRKRTYIPLFNFQLQYFKNNQTICMDYFEEMTDKPKDDQPKCYKLNRKKLRVIKKKEKIPPQEKVDHLTIRNKMICYPDPNPDPSILSEEEMSDLGY